MANSFDLLYPKMAPVYVMKENGKTREVPKMAFRIEIADEFRLDEFATEVYRDLYSLRYFYARRSGKECSRRHGAASLLKAPPSSLLRIGFVETR